MKKNNTEPISVFKWIWQSYLRTALIPLVVVELVFVGIYFSANNWSRWETKAALEESVNLELNLLAEKEAELINKQLYDFAHVAALYQQQTSQALATPSALDSDDAARLAYADNGAYVTTSDTATGGAAVFYSGVMPVNAPERDKVARLLALQPLMKDIISTHPLTTQVYFNSFDSLNVIYPYFNVLEQYPEKMNIPEYNFYYEADYIHNAQKKVVWTDAYLDPAGHGWMASAIAPVYNGDFLEGVVGIDVTISTIANQILNWEFPWQGYGILVGKDGAILALPQQGEADWGLRELTDHHYEEAITQDTFKPDDFNVYKRPEFAAVAEQLKRSQNGATQITLNNQPQLVSWNTVSETGWKLLVIVPKANVYQHTNAINQSLIQIGLLMIAGLILFYSVFFYILSKRSYAMSRNISQPLNKINAVLDQIGQGDYYQPEPPMPVTELEETAHNLIAMGQKLGDAYQALEKANRAKSEFLSQMSHELRTPLNAILGFSQLMEMNPQEPLSESQRQYVTEIIRAGDHLLNLINEILDLSRIESGRFSLSNEPVDLFTLVDEILSLMQPLADQNQVTLSFERPEPATLTTVTDRTRLKQILINLISNAIKYNRPNGQVTIRLEKTVDHLRFDVIDTGLGIPADQLTAIFDPFLRLPETSASVEGTGIGLTLVKQLCQLISGSIDVTSTPGEGSHFCLEIPFMERTDNSEKTDQIASDLLQTLSGQLYLLLYVEDNQTNLKLMEAALAKIPNIELLTATSGELGLKLAHSQKPDLIILDIHLSGMDGYAVLKQLKATAETRMIPVVALSASAMPTDIDKGIAMGFTDYFTKPLNVPLFLTRIQALLSQTK
ncbi:ATP-binding protein [Acetobacterium wieringae]|uniref:ATP-binding protein n=1 Tax=Acetobacterium wieringae TaxID=52694 RepID=UPI0026EE546C|nr:ATP-binding protein [Acetobacterium wieringae]